MLLLHYPWQSFLPLFFPFIPPSLSPSLLLHSFPAHPQSLSWGPLWLLIIHPIRSALQMMCGLRSAQRCLKFMLMNGDLTSHQDKQVKRCQRRCRVPVMDSSWMTVKAWMYYNVHVDLVCFTSFISPMILFILQLLSMSPDIFLWIRLNNQAGLLSIVIFSAGSTQYTDVFSFTFFFALHHTLPILHNPTSSINIYDSPYPPFPSSYFKDMELSGKGVLHRQ